MNYKNLFPIFSHHPELAFLDSASTTQKPQAVIDSISDFYSHDYANVHRGIYKLSETSSELFESSRETVKNFINAKKSSEIVFTRGTTESINLIAATWGEENIEADDEIILSTLEHHSNYLPWLNLATKKHAHIKKIPLTDDLTLDLDAYEKLLSSKTKLVTITALSNATGEIIDLKKIITLAHKFNATVIVDAAQSISHLKTDVQDLNCDFLVFSGHKMFGPTGIGILYGKAEILDKIPPYHTGGSMVVNIENDTPTYHAPPQKFEAGTPNIAGTIALKQAIQFIQKIELKNIQTHCQDLTSQARQILEQYPNLTIHSPKANNSIFSFSIEGIHPHDISTIFDSENVAIRAGHHCAKPLMEALKVPATARLSLHLYNTPQDLDKLDLAIKKCFKIFK
ncbi:cysteine desulfurase CsdA [Candidatus Peregrinibacteria bacterium HGW-Peregrinibacteria-1]|jgi:cysteine desulfurase/selenocysteine lyase|nr:MAG: cysteine desulfurase CsdA [Candidatus Peregrinibacteria bacterium HGW-Peregrinibacteria-1]